MKYVGSKNKYAWEILPIILQDRRENQWYVEPFVGGFNIIDKVKGNRIANDINYYLTQLFKALQEGWIPPLEVTEEEYQLAKKNKEEFPACLVGYIGFNSYGAKFFGGYRRDKIGKRNYWTEHYKNIMKQVDSIREILIYNEDYRNLYIPPNSIVYCDPPYAKSLGYEREFKTQDFWPWVRYVSKQGHRVFVSEYIAPEDFICIWSKTVSNTLAKDTGSKFGVEKLFIYKD
jgi:DNA adenine methylase